MGADNILFRKTMLVYLYMMSFLKKYLIILIPVFMGLLLFFGIKYQNTQKAEIFYKQSLDYLRLHDYKKAETYLGLAIKNSPKAEYFYTAYRLLIYFNRIGEAEIYLKKAIAKNNHNANYYYEAARLIGAYNEQSAIEYIKKAIKIEPKNCDYLRLYATLLYRLGEYPETYKQLNKCLEYDKADIVAWNNLAGYYSYQGEKRKSLAIWARATKANPKSAYVWYHYGLKAQELKENELAVKAFKQSIVLEPYSGAVAAKLVSEITGEKIDPTYQKYFDELKITLPFKYSHNCMLIPASVEGISGWFLLDTGASESHVYESFLKRNGLKSMGNSTGHYQTAGGVISVPIVYADFKVADLDIANVRVGVLPGSSGDDSVGIIGQNIIQHFKLEIDRANSRVILRAN